MAAARRAPGLSGGTGLGNTQPRYRSNPRPDYLGEARRLRQQGRVILEVKVSAEGQPASVSVKRSSGVASLDAAVTTDATQLCRHEDVMRQLPECVNSQV